RALLDAACAGGARALGRHSGRIEAGMWADLLALDSGALALDGLEGDTALDAWIFAARESPVRDVWSAGRHVVREGRHILRDDIEGRARAVLRGLREHL
ncbi:MAG: amidohydrolase family protein, partial [Alphaproteobacteria bacterium]